VIVMCKKTRMMFLAAALSMGGSALADDSAARAKSQDETSYDDSTMRPRETASKSKASGRDVKYDESTMEPGEVTGANEDANREQRDSLEYDDSHMKPSEK